MRPRIVLALQPTRRFSPPQVGCSHCWPLAVPTRSQSSRGLGDMLIIWRQVAGRHLVRAPPGREAGRSTGPGRGANHLLP